MRPKLHTKKCYDKIEKPALYFNRDCGVCNNNKYPVLDQLNR